MCEELPAVMSNCMHVLGSRHQPQSCHCCVQMLLAEERRLSGLRSEATRRVEIAEQALSAKDRQIEERVRAAAGADDALCDQR
jgi:hypothetical protein